jgi:hypothetical protein
MTREFVSLLGSGREGFFVHRAMLDLMETLDAAVFVGQCMYWDAWVRSNDESRNGWWFKTYDEWFRETRLSKYKVKTLTTKCESYGWLESRVKLARGAPTVYYRFSIEQFLRWAKAGKSNISLSAKGEKSTIIERQKLHGHNNDTQNNTIDTRGPKPVRITPDENNCPLTEKMRTWCRTRNAHVDVDAFYERFITSCRARGYAYVNPQAAFEDWFLREHGRPVEIRTNGSPPPQYVAPTIDEPVEPMTDDLKKELDEIIKSTRHIQTQRNDDSKT